MTRITASIAGVVAVLLAIVIQSHAVPGTLGWWERDIPPPASGSAAATSPAKPIPTTPPDNCNQAFFTGILPPEASLENIAAVPEGGSYGEGKANIAYPTDPTDLPALCAVTVNVTSSPSSSYRFGLFLPMPTEWSGRFLAVGNGGFAGGINWLDMYALVLLLSWIFPSCQRSTRIAHCYGI